MNPQFEHADVSSVDCPFCPTFPNASKHAWDIVLLESRHFTIVPTLGSILPGWILVVPKQHFLSFASIPKHLHSELRQIRQLVEGIMMPIFGSVTWFEHGASQPGGPVGCGIDHAHLHAVSLPFDMWQVLQQNEKLNTIEWGSISSLYAVDTIDYPNGYYFLEQGEQKPKIGRVMKKGIRQFFRRVIAMYLGIPEHFDYAEFDFSENAIQTVDAMEPHLQRYLHSNIV